MAGLINEFIFESPVAEEKKPAPEKKADAGEEARRRKEAGR